MGKLQARIGSKAQKFINKSNVSLRGKIVESIDEIISNTVSNHKIIKLTGNGNFYRYGFRFMATDYRIVFTLNDDLIDIIAIGTRENFY